MQLVLSLLLVCSVCFTADVCVCVCVCVHAAPLDIWSQRYRSMERREEHASVTKTVTFALNTQLQNGKGDGSSTWPFVSHRNSKFCRHYEGNTYARVCVCTCAKQSASPTLENNDLICILVCLYVITFKCLCSLNSWPLFCLCYHIIHVRY